MANSKTKKTVKFDNDQTVKIVNNVEFLREDKSEIFDQNQVFNEIFNELLNVIQYEIKALIIEKETSVIVSGSTLNYKFNIISEEEMIVDEILKIISKHTN